MASVLEESMINTSVSQGCRYLVMTRCHDFSHLVSVLSTLVFSAHPSFSCIFCGVVNVLFLLLPSYYLFVFSIPYLSTLSKLLFLIGMSWLQIAFPWSSGKLNCFWLFDFSSKTLSSIKWLKEYCNYIVDVTLREIKEMVKTGWLQCYFMSLVFHFLHHAFDCFSHHIALTKNHS